jgi:hypothetical protein
VRSRYVVSTLCRTTLTKENILGPRIALFIGTSGYVLFIASLWIYQAKGMRWLVILGGAVNGCCGLSRNFQRGSHNSGCDPLDSTRSYYDVLSSGTRQRQSIQPLLVSSMDEALRLTSHRIVYMMGSIIGCSAALGIVGDSREAGVSTVVDIALLFFIWCGAVVSWTILPPRTFQIPDWPY